MKKIISLTIVIALLLSSTSAFADGRRSHHGGDRGGVSNGSAIAIGVGLVFLGAALGEQRAQQQQQAPVQYAAVAPMFAPPVIQPAFNRGNCFPQGAIFPHGVNVIGVGFYPEGTQVPPGFCF